MLDGYAVPGQLALYRLTRVDTELRLIPGEEISNSLVTCAVLPVLLITSETSNSEYWVVGTVSPSGSARIFVDVLGEKTIRNDRVQCDAGSEAASLELGFVWCHHTLRKTTSIWQQE